VKKTEEKRHRATMKATTNIGCNESSCVFKYRVNANVCKSCSIREWSVYFCEDGSAQFFGSIDGDRFCELYASSGAVVRMKLKKRLRITSNDDIVYGGSFKSYVDREKMGSFFRYLFCYSFDLCHYCLEQQIYNINRKSGK